MNPKEIIKNAIDTYNPIKVLILVSGGHDSITNAHISASILEELNIPFTIYHGNTGIGIKETRQYVYEICTKYNWDLVVKSPPTEKDTYKYMITRWGFPGPTKASHQMCYRRLKERALRKYISHECKSSLYAKEKVLLLTGLRKSESKIRMGYIYHTKTDGIRIWCNPIFYFSEKECKDYMKKYNIPNNPVKEKICISGECLCGAFGSREELAEIKECFPETYLEINKLHSIAKSNGFPWNWGSGPTEWYKNHPPGQIDMFMCVGCEEKRQS